MLFICISILCKYCVYIWKKQVQYSRKLKKGLIDNIKWSIIIYNMKEFYAMIEVSKLNGEKYFVNAETIDFIEQTPDTVLTLASGKKVIVLETPSVIVDKVIAYKQKIYLNLPSALADMLDEMSEDRKDEQQF